MLDLFPIYLRSQPAQRLSTFAQGHVLYVGASKTGKLALQFVFNRTIIHNMSQCGGQSGGEGNKNHQAVDLLADSCTSQRGGTAVGDGVMPLVRSGSAFPGEKHNTKQQKSGRQTQLYT